MIKLSKIYKAYIPIAIVIFLFVFNLYILYNAHKDVGFWDNTVYLNNAKYFLDNSTYTENLRPPLLSVIILPFINFSYSLSIFFIIFVTLLVYFYSIFKLSQLFKTDFIVLLFFALNPLIIFLGLNSGPEFMYTGLIILTFVSIVQNRASSGFFLGLSILLRYNAISLIPLLLIQKFKSNIFSVLLLIVTIIPFLIYNKIKYDNYFTSIIESIIHNVLFHPIIPITIYDIIFISIPFFIILLIFLSINFEDIKIIVLKYKKELIVSALIYLITVIGYLTTPNKKLRFLLPSLLLSYTLFSLYYNKIDKKQFIKIIIIVLSIIGSISYSINADYIKDFSYNNFEIVSKEYNFDPECIYATNYIPLVSLNNLKTDFIYYENIDEYVKNNYNFIIFWPNTESELINNLNKYAELELKNNIYNVYYYKNKLGCNNKKYDKIDVFYSPSKNVCRIYNLCFENKCEYLDFNSKFKYKSYICNIFNKI